MSYAIDLHAPDVLMPCSFVASVQAGKTLHIREDGASMVVEPDGSQTRWIPAGQENWDSPWTRGDVMSGFHIYRSAAGNVQGVPRGYRMIV